MINRLLIIVVIFVTIYPVNAQVAYNRYLPKHVSAVANDTISFKGVIKLSNPILKHKDKINFGKAYNVSYNLKNSGQWDISTTGDRVWRLKIETNKASSISFMFDKFKLPLGGEVYLYGDEKKEIVGPYDATTNPKNEKLGSWLINSPIVWVLYVEPKAKKNSGVLNISQIILGYSNQTKSKKIRAKKIKKNLCDKNALCHVNNNSINDLKNRLIHSIVLINIGTSFCSGVLINNTNKDGKSYLLTANHCLDSDPVFWSFRFNFFDNFEACEDLSIPSFSALQSTSGAKIVAQNAISDFALLEIEGKLDPEWTLSWAGWSRQQQSPKYSFCLHYPEGNTMKVAVEDDALEQRIIDFFDTPTKVWAVSETNNGWEIGVTKTGSSGSPLFNEKGQIIGQLAGGKTLCNNGVNNNLDDWFGRFDVSWDIDNNPSKSLKKWLDPKGKNLKEVGMLMSKNDQSELKIFPNPTKAILNLDSFINNYLIFDVTGKRVLINNKTFLSKIDVSNLSRGNYFLKVISVNGEVFVKQFVKN